jgi:hypothetical protein
VTAAGLRLGAQAPDLMAVASLESGDLRYVNGSGDMVQEDTVTPFCTGR